MICFWNRSIEYFTLYHSQKFIRGLGYRAHEPFADKLAGEAMNLSEPLTESIGFANGSWLPRLDSNQK